MSAIHREAVQLLLSTRWGALATLNDGVPLGSMVAFAPEPGLSSLLLFLSGLAVHTRNLLAEPRASLVAGAPDTGEGDPQTLPRISVQGRVVEVGREHDEFMPAFGHYVARFPDAMSRLELADFRLFRLVPEEARYVGGFARATTISGEDLRSAAEEIARSA